jgi:hypothetical protein
MPTKPLLHKLAQHCLAWLTLLLVACGPGTGGTGTGPIAEAPISTTAPGTYSGIFTAAPSSQPVTTTVCVNGCTSTLAAPAVNLQVQTDSIQVSSPCFTFTYAGLWSQGADGNVTVQGSYTQQSAQSSSGTTSQPATLTLRFSANSDSVEISIKDAAGQTLLQPVTLQRVTPSLVAPLPGIC